MGMATGRVGVGFCLPHPRPQLPISLPAPVMRIMKLAKYRLKAQVEKDEGSSGEGQSPRVEKGEGPSGEG